MNFFGFALSVLSALGFLGLFSPVYASSSPNINHLRLSDEQIADIDELLSSAKWPKGCQVQYKNKLEYRRESNQLVYRLILDNSRNESFELIIPLRPEVNQSKTFAVRWETVTETGEPALMTHIRVDQSETETSPATVTQLSVVTDPDRSRIYSAEGTLILLKKLSFMQELWRHLTGQDEALESSYISQTEFRCP